MTRSARKKSETGIYHIIVRGINRQEIFHDEEDRKRYLEILARIKKVSGCEIYAYVLMDNHVHLVIKEKNESIGQIMKRVGTSYAYWYNQKYERIGHVFQDRYKSECIEDDQYLVTVVRYIHHNPVKAEMVKKPEHYKWTSCGTYYGKEVVLPDITETELVLGIFSGDDYIALRQFREFMEQENNDQCLESEINERISDEKACQIIKRLLRGKAMGTLSKLPREERDQILHQTKQIEGLSIRQISRITGIGYNIIIRA